MRAPAASAVPACSQFSVKGSSTGWIWEGTVEVSSRRKLAVESRRVSMASVPILKEGNIRREASGLQQEQFMYWSRLNQVKTEFSGCVAGTMLRSTTNPQFYPDLQLAETIAPLLVSSTELVVSGCAEMFILLTPLSEVKNFLELICWELLLRRLSWFGFLNE